MKLQFIGTGSGKTSLKRNHSSILLTEADYNILIDVGDGTSRALLSQGIKVNSIDSILFTHYHADHFSGIASLITQMKLNGRENPLTIYTHEKLIEPLKQMLNRCYLFEEKLGFDINFKGFEADEKIIINDAVKITARKNSHIKKTDILNNYTNINFISCSFHFEITGIDLNADKINIVYTSDIGSEEDLYLFNEISADYFITETTHVSLDEIYKFFKTSRPKRLLLTHIDDESEYEISRFISKLNSKEMNNILMTFDEFCISG